MGVELVGEDLLAVNVKRVKIAREKVNWIGTVTEAIAA
jgi:hypothetical protein